MSTPINPSSIMIYKIIKDFEQGKAINTFAELKKFAESVLKYANSKTNEGFWILESSECNAKMKDDLSKLCDLTTTICEFNEYKFRNGGETFAKMKIGAMPYLCLKGVIKKYKELQSQTNKNVEKAL